MCTDTEEGFLLVSEFDCDLNGKQQEWEAVVLIPFIDEKRLLDAVRPRYPHMTPDEKARNAHGPMCVFNYSKSPLGAYQAPDYFPPVGINHALQVQPHLQKASIQIPCADTHSTTWP